MVGTDKCDTCKKEQLLTVLRQTWDRDGNLELECWPCWEERHDVSQRTGLKVDY